MSESWRPVPLHVGAVRQGGGSDYRVGRLVLSRHFGTDLICAVDADPAYARQLLLEAPSPLGEGRAPLFVCSCCADLGCGAISVRVERTERGFVWSDFAWASSTREDWAVPPEMARTGPFQFDAEDYERALRAFAR